MDINVMGTILYVSIFIVGSKVVIVPINNCILDNRY